MSRIYNIYRSKEVVPARKACLGFKREVPITAHFVIKPLGGQLRSLVSQLDVGVHFAAAEMAVR